MITTPTRQAWAARLISAEALPFNFVRFYAVGLLLYMIPYTRTLFCSLTAPSLLLVMAAVGYHHRGWQVRTVVLLVGIAVASFALEAIGVATGTLFGSYQYDTSLGYKLWGTPLLIGANWVLLVYASQSIASQVSKQPVVRIVLGAMLMVGYDMVLEIAAPYMRMWHFDSAYPPINNFVVWAVAALVFHSLMVLCRIDVDNRPARFLFASQVVFFCILSAYSLLFIATV